MDIRSPNDISIENMKEKVLELLEYHTGKTGAAYKLDTKLRQKPVYMNPQLVDMLKEKCEKHQYQYREMTSGAAMTQWYLQIRWILLWYLYPVGTEEVIVRRNIAAVQI